MNRFSSIYKIIRRYVRKVFYVSFNITFFPLFVLLVMLVPKKRDTIIWGFEPLLNNKYWSNAIKKAGYKSMTFMSGYYYINNREDFDLYYEDIVPRWIKPEILKRAVTPFIAFLYVSRHASVVNISFLGGPLWNTMLRSFEAFLFRIARIKTVIIPYGADSYMYSAIADPSLRNGLLISYPEFGKKEEVVKERVRYWVRHADIVLPNSFIIDGIGRWDVTAHQLIVIDTDVWGQKLQYSRYDGSNGAVKVMHTPNHRGFKGTEFFLQAVRELSEEGLNIELVMLEKVPNNKIKEMMQEVDIFAEQFVFTGYALSGIEAMASGLPVLANLDNEAYTRVFRRYSFLNECPIVSTTPETIKENIRVLVTKPEMREALGRAGRAYIQKYHSFEMAQYLFGSIYQKILYNKDIDLMNLFHPLKSDFNKRVPLVEHPLKENKIS